MSIARTHGKENGVVISGLVLAAVAVYIFLSFFESYLTGFIGSNTKYYLLALILLLAASAKGDVRFNIYSGLIVTWLAYKVISLMWSDMSNAGIVQSHALSQIGMVLFFVVFTGINFEKKFIDKVISINLIVSFFFGVLTIVFPGSFIDERFVARQVLTLFGLQNDPNNCAVFLMIGIAIAGYRCFFEKRNQAFCVVVLITNAYALLLSASRGGLITFAVLCAVLVLTPKKGESLISANSLKKLFALLAVFVVGYIFVVSFLPNASLTRLLDFSDYAGGSGRDWRWEEAMSFFSQAPLFGCGWGGYYLTGGSVVHNTFLTSLCDGGIVGTLPLVLAIAHMLKKGISEKNALILLLGVCLVMPALFIDVINKRFFWNLLAFIAVIVLSGERNANGKQIKFDEISLTDKE